MRLARLHIALLLVLGALCLPSIAFGQLSPSQYDYPHNRLPWYTVETEHFNIHFQEGNSWSAETTARIAEEIYPGITSLYHYEPDSKVNIVLKDRQDYSNGASYFFDNRIDIWVPALNTSLRGTHNWLWDVITHEFTHIIQLQVAMKRNRQIPAIYLQWLSYSKVRRPDVLYGYPKGIISYPFASVNVPAWLAEGTAQYQRRNYRFDYWDSQRDMLLRTALLFNKPIGFESMGIFSSKNSLQRERIYNQGFAFTSYLAHKYGEDILPDITEALSKKGVFTVDKAIKNATGTSGKKLFHRFINETQRAYQNATKDLAFAQTTTVQNKGFFNFYPKTSQNGKRLAYLSNRKSRSSTLQLFIQDEDKSGNRHHYQTINLGQSYSNYPDTFGDALTNKIHSAYAFSPGGDSLVFSRQKLNSYGEQYDDLFIYDFTNHQEKRLTHSQRLSSPAWHPSRQKIVAVKQTGGSTNLVLIDLQNDTTRQLTNFKDGQQVFTPSWNAAGTVIYFAYSDPDNRNIYRLDPGTGKMSAVLQNPDHSYRDPFIDQKGQYLYYAADPDGIFNIYRIPLQATQSHPQKLSSVPGGAFMPFAHGNILYFSEFKENGYKISSIDLSKSTKDTLNGRYKAHYLNTFKLASKGTHTIQAHTFNVDAIPPSELNNLTPTDSLTLNLSMPGNEPHPILHPYTNTYTSFSFYPVIRFDNYSKKNGSNGHLLTAGKFGDLGENLLRDLKLGTYFSSRDVTDKLSIYGGALFGLASQPAGGIGHFFSPARLTDLDRDLLLSAEYRGLPFIKKRWSPTITIELNNLRRNVSDGLAIEEFPCTACLPDTTHADIAYNIWEADLYLRSKINAHNLVELGAGYSPYRVQTDGFFSEELQQYIPSSSSEYFRGTTFTAAYVYENFVTYPDADVAPVGLRASLRYNYEPNKLLDDYAIEGGTLSPMYKTSRNHSLEATVRYGYATDRHSAFDLYMRGFSYLNQPNDYFYLDYIGGFTGMRSYPYFAVGGNTTAMAQLSYTFPLLQDIHQQVGRYTLDKLFLRLFAETGNGWGGPLKIGDSLKTGIGTELRFAFNSYYLFPLKLFISGAYGFNKFDVTLPEAFITGSKGNSVTYGHELLFHFGLTFDFDVLNHD
ncbi:MAG TPA: hypothetical protein VJ964_16185 [Balneolaceae bacterium]|nr:hypothetical protein [Balneolaceae bacterium]